MKKRFSFCFGFVAAVCFWVRGDAKEVGFVEDFALASDRSAVLKQLLPGTDDYYYYHCVHAQNTGDLGRVDTLLVDWAKRHRSSSRIQEIRDRQTVLRYPSQPAKSLDTIRRRLKLQFNHQRRHTHGDVKTDYPTKLDPALIDFERLRAKTLTTHKGVSGFTSAGIEILPRGPLNPEQRRDLLKRLRHAAAPNIVDLILAELSERQSRGFGSLGIHRGLSLVQLDDCAKRRDSLLREQRFVDEYLMRLVPNADTDIEADREEKRGYLARLRTFVDRLAPSFNSLKAHVLYAQLQFSREEGTYDRKTFMAYLRIPRNMPYVSRAYLARPENRKAQADLRQGYDKTTLIDPVVNDEPLVRDYLGHFLRDARNYDGFVEFLREGYVKQVFAEVKAVNGIGDLEKWYVLMPAARFQALKERVDIEFLPTNPRQVAVDDVVRLEVAVKNVEDLLIKVYAINTINYYRNTGKELTVAVDLAGLVPNVEKTFHYDQVPLRRHVETFELPELKGRGVFVVELVGNGRSSRALIRKGNLHLTEQVTSAGHLFRVYDEARKPVRDAVFWLAGQEYRMDEAGEAPVPFASKAGGKTLVVSSGDFAVLHRLHHYAEAYGLMAGFHVDREALLPGEQAELLIRPQLFVTQKRHEGDLALLEDPVVTVTSTDAEGIESTREFRDVTLADDAETVVRFTVPENARMIRTELRGHVTSVTTGKREPVSASRTFKLNGIADQALIDDVHLRRVDGNYVLEVRGRTGEARPGYPVNVKLSHRYVTTPVPVTLQTDTAGRIELGGLPQILHVVAELAEGGQRSWGIHERPVTHLLPIRVPTGSALRLPWPKGVTPDWTNASLVEKRGASRVVRGLSSKLKAKGTTLIIPALTPGEYSLKAEGIARPVAISVLADAQLDGGHWVGKHRSARATPVNLLHVADITVGDEAVTVQLANVSSVTRVHVFATRFEPEYRAAEALATRQGSGWSVSRLLPALTEFTTGRTIGEEYRYILERRRAKRFPGNMLQRPGLLLNPWSMKETTAELQVAAVGEPLAAGMAKRAARRSAGSDDFGDGEGGGLGRETGGSVLDFLRERSLVLTNLRPDDKGQVRIPLKQLGTRRQLHIVALDGYTTVSRKFSLPDVDPKHRDLRLARSLSADQAYAEAKTATLLRGKQTMTIDDVRSGRFEVYGTLADVYRLLTALADDNTAKLLAEFEFVTRWSSLEADKQRELYSKYACHELSFFLHEHDPAFFGEVVAPYLRNKKDKTFLDSWLLGEELSVFLEPWAYGRLNAVERILLGQHVAEASGSIRRQARELQELIPPQPEEENRLFLTALRSAGLAEGGGGMMGYAAGDVDDLDFGDFGGGEEMKAEKSMRRGRRAAPPAPRALALADKADGDLAELEQLLSDARDAVKKRVRTRRKAVRQLFRQADKTKEWVENNYYELPIAEQVAGLITVNRFWVDYAQHAGKAPFLSKHLADAANSFAEMMLALAVLDLPFTADEPGKERRNESLAITPKTDAIVFSQEIRPCEKAVDPGPFLVSRSFYDLNDRYRFEGNVRHDKFVTEEFLIHRAYGCQVVLTNPTSAERIVEMLLQIPKGAIPIANGFYTRSIPLAMAPFTTEMLEFAFYFPQPGQFPMTPVRVAEKGVATAQTAPFTLNVVAHLTRIDTTSWEHVSQDGTPEEVIAFLNEHNIERFDLSLIAFRMRDAEFFDQVTDLLTKRRHYDHTLWSYALRHDRVGPAQEYLQHTSFARGCGMVLAAQLLTIDPVARHMYEHREYDPLINPRIFRLGARHQIMNDGFHEQYTRFLRCLQYRPSLGSVECLDVAYYLFLQDRVDEALTFFARVKPEELAFRLQYDYMQAYAALYREEPDAAKTIARRYRDYPVDRWRDRFRAVLAQVDEIKGDAAEVQDGENREQRQTQLADTAAVLDVVIEDQSLVVTHQNLDACRVSYFLMDVELLFSRNPFVRDVSKQFAVVQPHQVGTIKLTSKGGTKKIDIPKEYRNRNVMIEVAGGGVSRSVPYYPHAMGIRLSSDYGQVQVTTLGKPRPLSKVYVKVYARRKGGQVQFYKDGYTDLRGRFDYASLNSDELDNVERFALLIMSDEHGAVVRETPPPAR